MHRSVTIVGAGLAGLAAADELLDAGWRVTVWERRGWPGGRVYSINDSRRGHVYDNGQHVIMGCCTEFRRMLQRLGLDQKFHLQPLFDVPFLVPGRGVSRLRSRRLLRPLHLAGSFLAFRHWSWADKWRIGRLMWKIKRLTEAERLALDAVPFAQWLRENDQSPTAIDQYWSLTTRPTLNGQVNDVSTAVALQVFRKGMLDGPEAARIGYVLGPQNIIARRWMENVQDRGARVLTRSAVRQVTLAGDQWIVKTAVSPASRGVSAATIGSDAVVLAVGFWQVSGLVTADVLGPAACAALQQLTPSPIVNVHLWYDRRVTDKPLTCVMGSPLEWVFNRSRIEKHSPPDQGDHLTVTLSAAREWVKLPKQECIDRIDLAVRQAFSQARGAKLLDAVVVKEHRATFLPIPGCESWRPGPQTAAKRLALAGAWTNTGWPSTMEGALISGRAAARCIISQTGGRAR